MPVTFAMRGPVALPVVGPSYTGPGDIVSGALAWIGLRAYSAAAIGGNVVKLRESGGNTTQIFTSLANGGLDLAAIAAFEGANDLFVDTLYDQTGNGRHYVQATAGNQLGFILSGVGSLPVLRDVGGLPRTAQTAASVTLVQPFTVSSVAKYDGVAGRWTFFGDVGTNVFCGHRGTQAICYAGNEIGPTVSNGWHRAQAVLDGAGSDNCIDGVSSASNAGTSGTATALIVGSDGTGAVWNSDFTEVGVWGAAFSAGEKTAMDANQQAYWNI